jgi:hypothetical protein
VIPTEVLDKRNEYAAQFSNAKPFRHVEIEGFLDRAICQRLLDDFPSFETRYALNEMGEVGGKAVRMNVREISPAYRNLDQYLQTPEFLDFISSVTGIPDLLYDPDYIGGGTHENRDGQSLDAHVDFNYHPRTKTHRRLNLIVYLNHEWEGEWGGTLELHSNPWNPAVDEKRRVLPLFNSAVIFETNEVSWHGFGRIDLPVDRKSLSRKSFAIYLYTKDRPRAETAPSHGTIYVPDALPQRFVPGRTLDAADVADLQARFTRLRTQLRYLYDREQHASAQIAALEGAVAEARAALRVPMQGYAVQSEAPVGLWADGWIGTAFACRFVPQQKMRGLELDLWAPDHLDGDQSLSIQLGEKSWQHFIGRGARSRVMLDAVAAAGATVELRIRAERHFVPARLQQSGDDRELAWRLLGAALRH